MRRLIISALAATLAVLPTPALAETKALTGEESRYPHAIRLEHGPNRGDVLVTLDRWQTVDILRANRQGKKFKKIASFSDALATHVQCCGHLYELPQQVGDMPAGTVLWSGTVGLRAEIMRARIWRSFDAGETWEYLSECATADNLAGLWEPELSVDARGRLNCYFSDESLKGHSQYIGRTHSTDGVRWSAKEKIVAVQPGWYRPGMPHVKKLPTGEYYLSYEMCGPPKTFCEAVRRISKDGVDWGDPAAYGTRQVAVSGKYFLHTPSITLAPNGTPQGRMILIGQVLVGPDGKIDPGNGRTMFVSDSGGKGGWYEAPAPVEVPKASDEHCRHFHPTAVASLDGRSIIQFASDYTADESACVTSWGTGSLPPFPS
ncbi:hypothetical protein ACIA8G_14080 [Lentzea sp. NPDC051213]|uniref:hypothetical protein n=1 Tax=Lentzea sp. NPDC051213 TaxID=3364126 RepID=UPI0037A9DDF8